MSNRVKQIRQKGGNLSVPIGSQGQYIDMLSGLDLEQEFIIGGQHHVEITNPSSTISQINEWYGGSWNNYKNDYNYKTSTTITDTSGGIAIIIQLYKNSLSDPIHEKGILVSKEGSIDKISEQFLRYDF